MTIREITENVETYVLDIMQGRRRGFIASSMLSFLFVLSRLFRGIVKVRDACICHIGNISDEHGVCGV